LEGPFISAPKEGGASLFRIGKEDDTRFGAGTAEIKGTFDWPGGDLSGTGLPCCDPVSGAYFAFPATVRPGGGELRACALDGNAAPKGWY